MKRYCRAVCVFVAFAMCSAMEIGYQDQADIDRHNQYMQDKPDAEYVLVDLRQKLLAPRNIQQKASDAGHEYQTSDAMETDSEIGGEIFSNDLGNEFFETANENHTYDILISSNDGQRIHQLCQGIEQAMKYGIKDDQLANDIAKYLNYESYIHVPRNKWYSLQPYCLMQKEWQVNKESQPNEKPVEESDHIKRIETYVIAHIMYKYDVVNGFKLRFRYNKRPCVIHKRQKDRINDDESNHTQDDNEELSEIDD